MEDLLIHRVVVKLANVAVIRPKGIARSLRLHQLHCICVCGRCIVVHFLFGALLFLFLDASVQRLVHLAVIVDVMTVCVVVCVVQRNCAMRAILGGELLGAALHALYVFGGIAVDLMRTVIRNGLLHFLVLLIVTEPANIPLIATRGSEQTVSGIVFAAKDTVGFVVIRYQDLRLVLLVFHCVALVARECKV